MRYRIFIVEDHPLFREGLSALVDSKPEFEVCGVADNRQGALEGIAVVSPHLVIVDLQLRDSSGFNLIEELRASYPHLSILVLSMFDEMRYADRLFRMGASGYVMKDEGPATVIHAIKSVLRGGRYASERVMQRALSGGQRQSPIDRLTQKELEILHLAGQGEVVSEIANTLSRSEKTIQNHILNIQGKLEISSRQAFYQLAQDWVAHPERF